MCLRYLMLYLICFDFYVMSSDTKTALKARYNENQFNVGRVAGGELYVHAT